MPALYQHGSDGIGGRSTARKVPGKKHIVRRAIVFIAVPSFRLSCAMIVDVSASEMFTLESFCAMNWKTCVNKLSLT